MADFTSRIRRELEEEIRYLMGLLQERSEESCPDFQPVLSAIASLRNLVADVKTEVKQIESNIQSIIKEPLESKDDADGTSPDNQFSDPIEQGLWELTKDMLYDVNPLIGAGVETVVESVDEDTWHKWGEKITQAMQYAAIDGIKRDVAKIKKAVTGKWTLDLFGNNLNRMTHRIEDGVEQLKQDLADLASELSATQKTITDYTAWSEPLLSDVMQRCIDIDVKVDDILTNTQECCDQLNSKLDQLIAWNIPDTMASMQSAIATINSLVKAYGDSILNRVTECCVVDKVQSVQDSINELGTELNTVSQQVAMLTPRADLNRFADLSSAIRVNTGLLNTIRRLL